MEEGYYWTQDHRGIKEVWFITVIYLEDGLNLVWASL